MKSYTTLRNLYGSLSQNTSTANLTLGDQLINDEHRYLLQKYFNNEGTYRIQTVGAQNLTLTGAPSQGDVSATLTTPWAYYSTTVNVTFSNDDMRVARVVEGSTSLVWQVGLSSSATTAIEVGSLQYYPLPPNYSKLKDVTITVGELQWVPTEVLSRKEWDALNVFPYYSDIPNNYYIYPGGDKSAQIGIWPIPSTQGNIITFNYKYRVPDLSIADYTNTGTVSVANNGVLVTGATTTFQATTNQQLESRWMQFSPTASTSTSGDNLWYQIVSVNSTTSLTLYQPYQGTSITSSSTFTIGQMPILHEDFHDMLVYKALMIYFSSIVKDKDKFTQYKDLYETKLELLEEYAGSKTQSVNLRGGINTINPNLYPQNIGQ
ncbi:hypothetical protein E6Q11_03185 [Candidatus Dojkabacteria bacterium]|uniref:Uncharacterized protein n=1 Tax=Candidatus Dojkabacteria bacterium TaxID=2099670 RepID=A0A5C7J9G1_9BACT|nr:MAG: hypothetical protein E6Q11_03185 [Candidatus Dojkabacteria bacterium]